MVQYDSNNKVAEGTSPLNELDSKTDSMIGGTASLVPGENRVSGERAHIFSVQLMQLLHLGNAELPRVFTGEEDLLSNKTTSIRKIKAECKVLSIINHHNNYYVLLEYTDSGIVDLLTCKSYEIVGNKIGFKWYNAFSTGEILSGTILPEGFIYEWTDLHNNPSRSLQYGVNLKVYLATYFGWTYEDAYVISESAAEKLSHELYEQKVIKLKNNLTLNKIYPIKDKDGTVIDYKYFPDVGDIMEDSILCEVSNTINSNKLLVSDTNHVSKEGILYEFFPGAEVVDISVDTNIVGSDGTDFLSIGNDQIKKYMDSLDTQLHNPLSREITKIIEEKQNINATSVELDDFLCDLFDSGSVKMDHLSDNEGETEKKYINITITLKKKFKLNVGDKIVDRYSSKGICSLVLPDEEMPVDEHGRRAELILNTYTSINRLNPGNIYEQGLNYIADIIVMRIKEMEDKLAAFDYVSSFIKDVSQIQYDHLTSVINTKELKYAYIDELISGTPIRLLVPSHDDKSMDDFIDNIMLKYDITQSKIDGFMHPGIIGDKYIFVLEHKAISKLSSRSTGVDNQNGVPAKHKDPAKLHTKNPAKYGFDEFANLSTNINDTNSGHCVWYLNKLISEISSSDKPDRDILLNKITEVRDKYLRLMKFEEQLPACAYKNPIDMFRKISNSGEHSRDKYIRMQMEGTVIGMDNTSDSRDDIKDLPIQILNDNLLSIGLVLTKDGSIDDPTKIRSISKQTLFEGMELDFTSILESEDSDDLSIISEYIEDEFGLDLDS